MTTVNARDCKISEVWIYWTNINNRDCDIIFMTRWLKSAGSALQILIFPFYLHIIDVKLCITPECLENQAFVVIKNTNSSILSFDTNYVLYCVALNVYYTMYTMHLYYIKLFPILNLMALDP